MFALSYKQFNQNASTLIVVRHNHSTNLGHLDLQTLLTFGRGSLLFVSSTTCTDCHEQLPALHLISLVRESPISTTCTDCHERLPVLHLVSLVRVQNECFKTHCDWWFDFYEYVQTNTKRAKKCSKYKH